MKMIQKAIRFLTILIFIYVSTFGAQGAGPAQAAATRIEVDTGTGPAKTCEQTQIAVRVHDVADLTAYHLEISYNPDVIEIVSVDNGGFLGEPENDEFYEPTNSWATPGEITFGMAQQNTTANPIQPRDGSGDLILITLRARVPNGSTEITIDAENSALVNWPDAMPIAFTVSNATLETESCPPVAQDQSVTTFEDTEVAITLFASDPDGDELNWNIETNPANGTLNGTAPNLTYTPAPNFHGEDSFIFAVEDGNGKADTATVSITVTSVLDPPSLSSTDLAGPYMVGLNQEFHVTLTNPTYGDDFSHVLAKFSLGNISTSDIASIEYLETALEPDQWRPLPIAQDGSDVVGSFGPPAGFPMPPGYDATSSFRVNFNKAGTYPITVTLYDLTPEPDEPLAVYTAEVVVVDDLEVTDVALLSSVDQASWDPVPGSFAGGFEMPLNISEDWYYFDVGALTVAPRALADGSYPFYFGERPAGFFDYWAARGVTALADPDSMQGLLWKIINNQKPLFYLKVEGEEYTLVDGFTFEWFGLESPLRIEGGYLPGEYSFTGEVKDGLGFSDELEVAVVFNDIPVAGSLTVTTDEDTPVDITLSAIDQYPGGLTWNLLTYPDHGTLAGTAPDLTYTPDANWHGSDSFTFQVGDGELLSEIATVTIQVASINDAPVLADIGNKSVDEHVELVFTASASDVDVEDTLTFSLSGSVPEGAAINGTSGVFSWTPGEDQGGADHTFDVCVSDGKVSDCETITVTVREVNAAPVAVDDDYETDEDVQLVVDPDKGVLANDTDTDLPKDPLAAEVVTGVSHGILQFNADGSFSYTPNLNFLGYDSFTYRVSDGKVWSNTATVRIHVHEQNDPPVAQADAYTTDEDTALTVAVADGLLVNDSDMDGDLLTAVLVTPPSIGVLDLEADGSFTYIPAEDFFGTVTFTYVADDGIEQSAETTVTITVKPVDDPTVALSQSVTIDEDTPVAIHLGVIEVDGDPLVWTVSDPQHGTLNGTPPNLTYTPNENFHGDDSFTFRVHDGTSQSNTATVSITVKSVNDIPVGVDDAYETDEDELLIVSVLDGVLVNDSDVDLPPQTLSAILFDNVDHGTLLLTSDGSFLYQPAKDFSGEDIFKYRVYDGEDYSPLVTVRITVHPVNDSPIAANDVYSTDEDTPLMVAAPGILGNDSDPDGDILTAVLVGGPTMGTLDLKPDGAFTYTPPDNIFGSASFTYLATDGISNSSTQTVFITIEPVEDAPVLAPIGPKTAAEGVLLTFTVSATDADPGTTLTFSLEDGTAGKVPAGAQIDPATGVFSWTPDETQGGADYTFDVCVSDGVLSDCETITVTVARYNTAPMITGQKALTTPEDTQLEILISDLTIVDPDDTEFTLVILPGDHYTFSGAKITPAQNFVGTLTVNVKVNDGEFDSPVYPLVVEVTPVNDAPVAFDQSVSTGYETPAAITLTMTDVDGDNVTWVVLTQSSHGVLSGTAPNLTYTPARGFTGSDSFTFKVNDGSVDSNIATVTITVGPPPQVYIYLPIIHK